MLPLPTIRSNARAGARVLVLMTSPLLLAHASAATVDWPQYRGPGALGTADGGGSFGDDAGTGLQVAWKRPLGSGYSSVVVAGEHAVTMFSDGDSDVLAAFDVGDGHELWRYTVGPRSAGHDGSHDGPLSTPLVGGGKVVGLSTGGRLFAVDLATGKEAWSVDTVERYEATKPFYGFGTSPVLADGVVVLELPVKEAAIAGFDLATGERLWKAGDDQIRYQTPAVMQQGGRPVVVAAGLQNLYGIDPRDGRVLWQFEHGGGGGAYGAAGLTPVPAGENRLFLAHKDEGAKVVLLSRKDDVVVPETLWENRNVRNSYSTPVYHDGFLYAFSSRFLTCIDVATGEPRWRSREPGDGFLMLVDDTLVIVTKEGSIHLARATPDGYEEVAGLPLFEDHAWSPPSFAAGHVFVRSLSELARVDLASQPTAASARPAPGDDLTGTVLGRFLETVAVATDKADAVDRFLASVETFPMIEGNDRVTFLYRGPAQDVAVGGDLMEVSRERKMTRVEGTDLFYYSTRVEPDARLNYVLFVDYQQVPDPRNPRKTETSVVTDDLELSFGGSPIEMSWFAMPEWREPSYLGKAKKGRRGKIETRKIDSAVAGSPFEVSVYLPAGYGKGAQRYPVVYVHDGPEAQDQGAWPTALDNLIGETVEPLIAVFIGPIQAQGPDYNRVFAEELVPYIDANFRTVPSADRRANVGGGINGVAALMCTFGAPTLVSKVAAQSPFLIEFAWGPLQSMIRPASETPVDVYLDWGEYDLRNSVENWNLVEANRNAMSYLREKGYSPAGGEVHDGSGWPSWRNRTGDLLVSLFPLPSDG